MPALEKKVQKKKVSIYGQSSIDKSDLNGFATKHVVENQFNSSDEKSSLEKKKETIINDSDGSNKYNTNDPNSNFFNSSDSQGSYEKKTKRPG